MAKFPVDAPKAKVLRTLAKLGFEVIRERKHIALARNNSETQICVRAVSPHVISTVRHFLTICKFEQLIVSSLLIRNEVHYENPNSKVGQ